MLTIADKPKNARGNESYLWDLLIDADHEIIMANRYYVTVRLKEAEALINENGINPNLRTRFEEVCERYHEKYGEIRS